MKLKKRGMDFLKAFHVLAASVWFGGIVIINVLAWFCFLVLDKDGFLVVAPLIPSLYRMVVLPTAVLAILQGVVYGFATSWGFFKHRWIVTKWVAVILTVLLTGVGAIGQMLVAIENVKVRGLADGAAGNLADGGVVLCCLAAQALLLAGMIVLSVYKPSAKRREGKKQMPAKTA